MDDQSHRGSRPFNPSPQFPDRRVLELDDAMRTMEAASRVGSSYSFTRDSVRGIQNASLLLGSSGRIVRGTVIHALPHLHWYKVQIGGLGWVACCALSPGGLLPMGPKRLGVFPPTTSVLVHLPDRITFGVILGALPPAVTDPAIYAPDWLLQGGGSGLLREEAHRFVVTGLNSGVLNYSAGRPLDETAFDSGWVSALGVRVAISDFEAQVAVNEMCGLFLNYVDSHARLAGVNLDVESAVHEERGYDDEGESRYAFGVATYPWEAIGRYTRTEPFTEENDDKETQYTSFHGAVDLKEDDTQPLCRYVEYGGYLGQGHYRAVLAPGEPTGIRRYSDANKDVGLFVESIGLDGSYTLLAAKRLHIGKRVKITAPKEVRLPADPTGDDARAGNYKFSGAYGSGDEHKIGDVTVPDAPLSGFLRAAAIADLTAHAVNWRTLHPFHYHAKDYDTPQEKNTQPFSRAQDDIDFSVLADQSHLDSPSPTKLNIDERYGDVEYFERESFITFHDDGTVQMGCGYGSSLILGHGKVRVDAPAGIVCAPGNDFVVLADQIVLRAKTAMDLSVATGDLRFKAEKNMQFLAGNGGTGGMLFENKSSGSTQDYSGKFGSEVDGRGIVFRTTNSPMAFIGQSVYVRTDGGDILLDAGRGANRVQVYGREFHAYTRDAVTFNFGPNEDTSNVTQVYAFTANEFLVDTSMLLGGILYGYKDSGIIIDGKILATEDIATASNLASRDGGQVGSTGDGFADQLTQITQEISDRTDTYRQAGEERHQQTIVQSFYQSGQLGNEDTLTDLHFSFRDPPGSGEQYHTNDLLWPESRWQTMARLGGGTGGVNWTEPAVKYQGEETYPWPGRQKWKEDSAFLRLKELTMYDAGLGTAKDRPGPYEDAQLSDWERTTMEDGLKLIR